MNTAYSVNQVDWEGKGEGRGKGEGKGEWERRNDEWELGEVGEERNGSMEEWGNWGKG